MGIYSIAINFIEADEIEVKPEPFPTVLAKISHCESWDTANIKNASSTASGRFQFIHSTWVQYAKELWGSKWKEKNVMDWDDNTELALYVYKKYGTHDWFASKGCWNK